MTYRAKKYQNIIAIDPDVDKSGVAYLKPSTRQLELTNLTFPQLVDYLQQVKSINEEVIIVVEAGWLNRSHWHTKKNDRRHVAAAKGNSVGRNHEVGRKIIEMCNHYELEVVEQRPLRKTWLQNKEGKISHEELKYFTGIKGRTNQETRDAALIAWNYAGLPIRIRVAKTK